MHKLSLSKVEKMYKRAVCRFSKKQRDLVEVEGATPESVFKSEKMYHARMLYYLRESMRKKKHLH